MRILTEDIIHTEASVDKLSEKVHWNPGSLYDRLPAKNPRVRLYRHRASIPVLASNEPLINRVHSAQTLVAREYSPSSNMEPRTPEMSLLQPIFPDLSE